MTDSGVVDRLRVPDWVREPVEEVWRETPVLVRLFVGLALIDIVSRGIGILQPRYEIGADLFGAYLMLVPHDLWILLPAVLVLRRPDAPRATPLVFWGAVTIALTAVIQRPLENLAGEPYGPTNLSFEVDILGSIATLLAFLFIARGLAALNPVQPTSQAAGFSNLVLGLGLVGVLFEIVQGLASTRHTGVPALDGLFALNNVIVAGRELAWPYLLWIVIRGLGDTRRPETAVLIAVIGAAISGLFDPVSSILRAVALGIGGASGVGELGSALGLISIGVGQAMVIVAFALGLAEPPIPYARPLVLPAASETPAAVAAPVADAEPVEDAPPASA